VCKTAEDILHGYLLGDSYIAFSSVGNMLTSTVVSLISCDRLLTEVSCQYDIWVKAGIEPPSLVCLNHRDMG